MKTFYSSEKNLESEETKMKQCELCKSPARMYCESDQASLCWECDSKVHSANFLVARHSRSLLCHVCQCSTPWQASGSKLGSTVTVCERCVSRCNTRKVEEDDDEDEEDETDGDDDEDDDGEEDEEEEEEEEEEEGEVNGGDDEDGENQVVPWSSSSSSSTPPPPSSSSSEESSSKFTSQNRVASLKRTRENEDNFSCLSTVNRDDSDRPLSDRKRALTIPSSQTRRKSEAILNSVKQLEQNFVSGNDSSFMVLEMFKLSRDPNKTIDLVPSD